MGCHTWFSRPVTEEELSVFKSHAIEDAYNLWGDTEENKEFNSVDIDRYIKVKESVENDTDYWWKEGYGTRIIDGKNKKNEYVHLINGVLYLDLARPVYPIFENLKRYHDVFRVKNYPSKVIHSRRELRKWMKKKYFDLDDWQLEKISEFFRENPGGIITFG